MWLYLSEVDELYFLLGWRGAVFFPQAVVSGELLWLEVAYYLFLLCVS